MATANDIDQKYQPTLVRTSICLDSELVLEIDRLTEQFEREKTLDEQMNRTPVAPGLAERIVQLRGQAKDAEVEFVFASIGRKAYTDLRLAHPASKEQEDNASATLGWDPDTFPPALLALSVVEPTGTTAAWWARKYDEWGTGQITRLWGACMAAQGGVVEVPKAIDASVMTSDSPPSSS